MLIQGIAGSDNRNVLPGGWFAGVNPTSPASGVFPKDTATRLGQTIGPAF